MPEGKVDFYRHGLGEPELEAARQVLSTLFLTTGPACAALEEELAAYLGARQAVTVSSCTAALELALMALGVGRGDEVITSPMTFIATANACLYVGAKPVFVDVEPETGNLRAELVQAAITPRTKAIMPVHLYGVMCDMPALRAIADEHHIKIVADCAHALEARRRGLGSAGLADVACYSFYATKNLSCGEGGALATDSPELAEKLKVLRLHGMSKSAADRHGGTYQHWDMEALGKKANLPDLLAAMLRPQIPRLKDWLARRRQIAAAYEEAFAVLPGVDFPRTPQDAEPARHLFTIWVERRDEFISGLQQRGIGCTVNYRPVHLTAYYQELLGHRPGDFPEAERIGGRTISLPLYPGLSDDEVSLVIAAVKDTAAELNQDLA